MYRFKMMNQKGSNKNTCQAESHEYDLEGTEFF